MSSYTITGHGYKKPIVVKEHTRFAEKPVRVAKRKTKKVSTFKRNALVAIIIIASYFITFYAGQISMYTKNDWDNIGNLGLSQIASVLPMPKAHASKNQIVIKDGVNMRASDFCIWAVKDSAKNNMPLSRDVKDLCTK